MTYLCIFHKHLEKKGLCFTCEERENSKRRPKDHAVPKVECTYHESNGYIPELSVKWCDEYKDRKS